MGQQLAQPAIGVKLYYGNGSSPESYTLVTNDSDLTGLSMSATIVDVTSHSSPAAPWRQKIPTLLDPGDLQFKLFFLPGDSGHQQLLDFFATRGQTDGPSPGAGFPIDWKLVFPDTNGTTWTFQGFITKFSTSNPVAGVIEAQIVITCTGNPAFPNVIT
jgi:Lambda phage tail tube protein, TTP